MKSYGGTGTEILVFGIDISATRMKIVPHKHSNPGARDGFFFFDKIDLLLEHSSQNGINFILHVFPLLNRSMQIIFTCISKSTRVDKTTIVAKDTSLCSIIKLVLFFECDPGLPG